MKRDTLTCTILAVAMFMTMSCGKGKEEDEESESPYPEGYSTTADSTLAFDIAGVGGETSLLASSVDVTGKAGTVIGTLSLTDAKVVLKQIQVKMTEASLSLKEKDEKEEKEDKDKQPDADDLQFNGPYLADLIANTLTPSPDDLDVPAGNYKKIELKVHKVSDDDLSDLDVLEGDALYDNSIYVGGTYTPTGGSAVAFSLTYDLTEKFTLAGDNGMDVAADSTNNFMVAFDLSEWFDFSNEDVDFSDLTAGAIALSKSSDDDAKDVRKAIKDNIKASAKFGKDSNKDGTLSTKEDSDK